MTSNSKGYLIGVAAAVSYGTNPLFAIPLYERGLSVMSVLFYRYLFATLILGAFILWRGGSLRINRRECPMLILLGVLFALSSVFLFDAYRYMDVGIASTLLYIEPVMIAVIMWLFYRQHISLLTAAVIAVCMVGVGCLCNPGPGADVTAHGVLLVMLSSLSYSFYMVIINQTSMSKVSGMKITFYSLLFGQLVFMVCTRGFTELQSVDIADPVAIGCIIGISVVPTIVSLLAVTISIKYVGALVVSILGAFEPITGLVIGSLMFGEILTPVAIIGIILILSSVIAMTLLRRR